MVRPLRIEYPNAWYHVTGRGVARSPIFKDDKDRLRFLEALRESVEAFNVEVHCYVLMSNHFHFLLKTPETNLSRFMQRFNTAYSTYFNLRHHRAGHLYQGRFKGLLVEADEYLQELSRYIHLNPVRIKRYSKLPLEERSEILRDYRWSSLPGYIRLKSRDEFMSYSIVLGYKGGDAKEGRRRYREYVLRGLKYKIDNPKGDARANAILGSDSFIVWVKENFLSEIRLSSRDFSNLKTIRMPMPIKEIAEAVAEEYGVMVSEITKKYSKHREARLMLLELCYRLNLRKRSTREMGTELGGISGEQVIQAHRLMQKRIKEDRVLWKRVEEVTSRLQT
ncbi:MAG: transposase [Candidatus Euphemobacter frigidus]|nr:transposase [Candidatus Euphemobacter frigidus]